MPDPRPEIGMIRDMLITLEGKAEATSTGFVLPGSKKVKIGSSIQLQGNSYDFNGTVVSIELKNS